MFTPSQFSNAVIPAAPSIADQPSWSLQRRRSTVVRPLMPKSIANDALPTQDFQHFRQPELARFYAIVLSQGGRIGC
ncbi:hypothetical protein ACN4EK_14735 [Pantanalinema rosaneae CENA516]|uniref:hypothetical protein n=1 Tax=Pantanalinema rosaneae TaxID=1620701 RepID=UPI003D6FE854